MDEDRRVLKTMVREFGTEFRKALLYGAGAILILIFVNAVMVHVFPSLRLDQAFPFEVIIAFVLIAVRPYIHIRRKP